MVASVAGYFDKISAFLMNLRSCFPRYSEYQSLYASSSGLQDALCGFDATVISFCGKAVDVVQRSGKRRVVVVVRENTARR